jgi:hypothetical protein
MIFWLVLTIYSSGPTTALHVGNFSTMAACQAAGRTSGSVFNGTGNGNQGSYFLCVQANDAGTKPPP